MIRRVLIVPAPGDPGGLLREGPCGAKPPTVGRTECPKHGSKWRREDIAVCCLIAAVRVMAGEHESALALAWKGEVVPEGYDRAKRVALARGVILQEWALGPDQAVAMARACEALGLGTVVVEEAP